MRIALRRVLRIQTLARTRYTLSQCRSYCPYHHRRRTDSPATRPSVRLASTHRFPSDHRGKDSATHISESVQSDGEGTRSKSVRKRKARRLAEEIGDIPQNVEDILYGFRDQRRDPNIWLALLDRYIPHDLGGRDSETSVVPVSQSAASCAAVLEILNGAKRKANVGFDLLAHMIVHSRRKAALWICDLLIKNLSSRFNRRPKNQPPSNVMWPSGSLDEITSKSIRCHDLTYKSTMRCDEWENQEPDPRYSFDMTDLQDRTMDQIWHTLGIVVAQSADMAEVEGQRAMNAVHLILGQIHNLDLVPENVYNYRPTPFTTAVQRPPIVHLVSSRILTALSDAAWREHQDEVIEKAASHGVSYKEIGRDPPGGRFRLKVSPMGPQIWLEFILWCCVEGGFANAGARIIDFLKQDLRDPWFAVAWSTRRGTAFAVPQIDWDRVKARSGGTVGRIEGYSREKPLAEVPPKTISTEVLLALVETHVNATRRQDDDKGMVHNQVQRNIVELVAFLEPHDLPLSYFDYVAARLLLMTDNFDGRERAPRMQAWVERLSFLKSLRSIQHGDLPRVSFKVDDLAVHSEFGAGLVHQVLDAYVCDGNVHEALTTFDGLQRLVDNSKLHAISAFLQGRSAGPDTFFSSRPFGDCPDFVKSHGQLPLHKLAGLLNLATEAKLIGFGQWLLYSEDPDGPLIPKKSYSNSSIARALVRFAGMSGDVRLLRAIPSRAIFSQKLPTVNFLRVRFDACVSLLNFKDAAEAMKDLRTAEGGGFSLSNLTHLASIILKLESHKFRMDSAEHDRKLRHAIHLFDSMLSGQSSGRSGVLQRSVRAVFRQQIGHLLRVFQSASEGSLASIASTYMNRFPVSNVPNLSPTIFNVFLDAVMQSTQASRGMELVQTFCTDGSKQQTVTDSVLPGDHVLDEDEGEDSVNAMQESAMAVGHSSVGRDHLSQAFIPFVIEQESRPSKQETAPPDVAEDGTIRDDYSSDLADDASSAASTPAVLSSPFFPETQGRLSAEREIAVRPSTLVASVHGPVCTINPRTVTLVARAAMREKSKRESEGLSVVQQDEVLSWAKGRFTRLSFPQFLIMNEIKEPLSEADIRDFRGVRHFKPNSSSRIVSAFGGRSRTTSKS